MLENYGEALIEYEGQGNLLGNNATQEIFIPVTFRCMQLHKGNIFIHAEPTNPQSLHQIFFLTRGIKNLEGQLSDGRVFRTPQEVNVLRIPFGAGILLQTYQVEIYQPDYGSENTKKVRFYLTNLAFLGTESVEIAEGYQVNGLPLDFGQTKATLLPVFDYEERLRQIGATKLCSVTAMLEVEATGEKLENLNNFAENVCTLLSFAKGTLISSLYSEQLDNLGNPVFTTHKPAVTLGYSTISLINKHPAEMLKTFLESTYSKYTELKDYYSLTQVINTLCYSKYQKDFCEASALNAGTLVEILRARWATNRNRELVFPEDEFKAMRPRIEAKIKEALKDVTHTTNQRKDMKEKTPELNRPAFKTVLKEMIAEINADISHYEVDRFVARRDSLVHTGRFLTDNFPGEMLSMQYVVDKLILALLEYKGDKEDYRSLFPLENETLDSSNTHLQ